MYTIVAFVVALFLFALSLQFSGVQTFVARQVTHYLSKELNTQISLGAIYFKPFSSLTLHDLEIKDQQGARMIYSKRLYADLNLSGIFNNQIRVNELRLTDPYIDFQSYGDSSNFTFLINYFSTEKKSGTPKKPGMQLELNKVALTNAHLIYDDNMQSVQSGGVDFAHVELTDFSGVFDEIKMDSTETRLRIEGLSFMERSGFHLKELNSAVHILANAMEFDQLYLQTNRSLLRDYLKFEFAEFGDFGDFLEKVVITANIDNAFVDSKDIEFFAPTMQYVRFTTDIEQANISGTVADIAVRDVKMKTEKTTVLHGDFTIRGLPDIDKTIFDFRAKQLVSSAADAETLVRQLSSQSNFSLPDQLHRLASIRFNGVFTGPYNNFRVDGLFATALGQIRSRASFDIRDGLSYSGNATSTSFDIGNLLDLEAIGHTGIDVTFFGNELDFDRMRLQASGKLENFQLKSQRIASIGFDASVAEKAIQAIGYVADANVALSYDARIDLMESSPSYALESAIDSLHLSAFGLVKNDSILIRETSFRTNLVGTEINDITGFFSSDQVNLFTATNRFTIRDVSFSAGGNQEERTLQLRSNVMDIDMDGVIDLNTIVPYFKSVAMQYAPAIGFDREQFSPQLFNLDINVKSFAPVSALLGQDLELSDGAQLTANFSSDEYLAKFAFFSPELRYRGMRISNLSIVEDANEERFALDLMADRFYFTDSLYAERVNIESILANDSLFFAINAASDSSANYLRLNGNVHFANAAPAIIRFEKSDIVLADDHWDINEENQLRISGKKIYIENLTLSQEVQSVTINGVLSDENETLRVEFNRFALASLQALTNPLGIDLRGEVNGRAEVTSVFNAPYVTANLSTTPIIYNDLPIGQLVLNADYRPEADVMELKLNLLDGLNRGLKVNGQVNFAAEQEAIQLRGEINDVELIVFQPFLRTLVRDMSGRMSGDIQIGGSLQNPVLTGTATFHRAEFKVIYLNTTYIVDDQRAIVERNVVRFQDLKLRDNQNHEALAAGFLDLNELSDPLIDVAVTADNFLVLNTTYKENNLYYGTAYASGVFTFKGRTSGINVDIDARSNSNTVIHIPFDAAMTVSDSDFIYFVEAEQRDARDTRDDSRFFQGLTMNMNLRITPGAEINLQTDIGSLRGTGSGEVQLRISSLGDFEMFGDYTIDGGNFHFTAQDFINKYFDIKEGGTVRWTGDPTEAIINIVAFYQQRTSIGALYNSAGRPGQDERVLAQADMIITGTLSQPDISFDLSFPLNPYVKDELQAYLSDANNVNQQALSLIVRRSFTATSASEFGREVNNTLLSAGTEIAFNQLNAIISQSLNINFLDLNIRSFNDASASLRLFDDRLILTGGITDQRNLRNTDLTFFSNDVVTDAELTYRIRRDGSLMFRAYNRLNTRNILFTPTDDYINAVGLVYRQEFNTFQEFFKRMMTFRRRVRPALETALPDTTAN